jgi:hypothetical protein
MRVGISALPIIPSLTGGAEAEAGDYEIYLSWLAEFLLHIWPLMKGDYKPEKSGKAATEINF